MNLHSDVWMDGALRLKHPPTRKHTRTTTLLSSKSPPNTLNQASAHPACRHTHTYTHSKTSFTEDQQVELCILGTMQNSTFTTATATSRTETGAGNTAIKALQ